MTYSLFIGEANKIFIMLADKVDISKKDLKMPPFNVYFWLK